MKLNRAYSLLTIKAVDEDQRIIEGIATTPSPDRVGDVVEPKGAEFKLPLPLLLHHDSAQPIGHVISATVTAAGIKIKAQIAKIADEGPLKNRLDEAWQSIKAGLIKGLSIGFKPLEQARIGDTYTYRYIKWLWLELSAVTIPANGEATITTVKSIDTELRAAAGQETQVGDQTDANPGVTGKPVRILPATQGNSKMKKISEQIAEFSATRKTKMDRMEAILSASADRGETLNAEEEKEYETLEAEVAVLSKHIDRLQKAEAALVKSATPVNGRIDPNTVVRSNDDNVDDRSVVVVKSQKLPPGILFTRLTRCKIASVLSMKDGNFRSAIDIAKASYGHDSQVVDILSKATVAAASTAAGNWAVDLISSEGAAVAEFLEYLRPQTIIGKFAAIGKPLNRIPFYAPVVTQTAGGSAYWTGEGKPKGLTALDFDRTTLTPLKIANIAVATKESLQFANPSLETILRDQLAKAIIQGVDLAFVDPTNAGSANVKPASVTNGTVAMTSTGPDVDDVDLDVRALFQRFIDANNAAAMSVWGMSETNAVALSMMKNALGQKAFPDVTINGGFLAGLPVIVSNSFGSNVVLFATDQILIGGDDNVSVDMSDQASLEMLDSGFTQNQPTGAVLVSLWQNNMVALRAEMQINWKKGRPTAAQYIESAVWGGAVPPS